ncbi:unnamed protein product [Malus baccata var. baccata]
MLGNCARALRFRYVNDGRPFWQYIVSSSTGCSDSQCFEELYNYYTTDKAWHLCDPNAEKVVEALRKAGVKVAVVSNFDARLRPLLHDLCFVYENLVFVFLLTRSTPFLLRLLHRIKRLISRFQSPLKIQTPKPQTLSVMPSPSTTSANCTSEIASPAL